MWYRLQEFRDDEHQHVDIPGLWAGSLIPLILVSYILWQWLGNYGEPSWQGLCPCGISRLFHSQVCILDTPRCPKSRFGIQPEPLSVGDLSGHFPKEHVAHGWKLLFWFYFFPPWWVFPILELHIWNHIVGAVLCAASLTQHDQFEVCPHCCML